MINISKLRRKKITEQELGMQFNGKALASQFEDQISGSLELTGQVRCVDSNPGDVETGGRKRRSSQAS